MNNNKFNGKILKKQYSREKALQILYSYQINKEQNIAEIINLTNSTHSEKYDNEHLNKIVTGVLQNLESIDDVLAKHLDKDLNTLSNITLTIARIGYYEIAFTGLDFAISIKESIRLAKLYDSPKTYKLINKILEDVAISIKNTSINTGNI